VDRVIPNWDYHNGNPNIKRTVNIIKGKIMKINNTKEDRNTINNLSSGYLSSNIPTRKLKTIPIIMEING
jgi:hypothetical protein